MLTISSNRNVKAADSLYRPESATAPVAIGGVGGSGTRLVAELLNRVGFYTGADQNVSNDNLWFTLLFKRPDILELEQERFSELTQIFFQAMERRSPFTMRQRRFIEHLVVTDRPQHDANWLALRAESLLAAAQDPSPPSRRWGWKEPNTHVVIDRLAAQLPGLKYVHVVRNGLDMAFSNNQNQLRLWGGLLLGEKTPAVTPRNSLRYWHAVHERILEIGRELGNRFLLFNFDQMCLEPEQGLETLMWFLDTVPPAAQRRQLLSLIRPPSSIGRFKQQPISQFDPSDIEFADSLGFDTQTS